MNIELIEDETPSCTLSEIFQPMVPWVAFASGLAIGCALTVIYLKSLVQL
jgi:hypothetical protein